MQDPEVIQQQIQALLPPGFSVFGCEFYREPETDSPTWFRVQFTYADQHKYISVWDDGIDPRTMADIIMLSPLLEYADVYPHPHVGTTRMKEKSYVSPAT